MPSALAPQVDEDAGNQILEHVLPAEYRRSRERVVGEIGLQRLTEPALVLSGQVVFDRKRTRSRHAFASGPHV